MPRNSILESADLRAGALFVALGAAFLWIGTGYGFGSMLRMGPGFFPVVLSVLLIAVGAAVLIRGLSKSGERITFSVAPAVRVLGAVAAFAGLVQPAGLYVTLPVVTVLAASASRRFRWRAALLLAAGLTLGADLLFRVALGLPLRAFGPWFGG